MSRPDDSAVELHADRDHRERVYHEVLSVVAKTDDDRPGIGAYELWCNRYQAGLDMSTVRTAVRAACEHDDLLKIHDPDGRARYVLYEPDALREAVSWVGDWDNTDQDIVGTINRALRDATTDGESRS